MWKTIGGHVARFFQKPAVAGDKEVTVSDTPNTATPPATSGGPSLTKADLEALLKPLAETISGVVKTVEALGGNHKALAESVAKISQGIKAEDVAGLVTKQLAEHQAKAQADAAKAGAKADLRKKVIAARLPGVDESLLASLPDTEDEKALTDAANTLRGTIEKSFGKKFDDVGGAAKDGGKTPAAEPAKPAGFLKMKGGDAGGAKQA
jgi:hypothetical protein